MSVLPAAGPRLCPDCGIGFMEFRRCGRFGCPHDYEYFRDDLAPILDRLHRADRHSGKRPRRFGATEDPRGTRRLRFELAAAVAAGDYEQAARLRDRLRAEERDHGL